MEMPSSRTYPSLISIYVSKSILCRTYRANTERFDTSAGIDATVFVIDQIDQ